MYRDTIKMMPKTITFPSTLTHQNKKRKKVDILVYSHAYSKKYNKLTWIHQDKTLHIWLLETSIYLAIAGTKNNTTSIALVVKYIAAATI